MTTHMDAVYIYGPAGKIAKKVNDMAMIALREISHAVLSNEGDIDTPEQEPIIYSTQSLYMNALVWGGVELSTRFKNHLDFMQNYYDPQGVEIKRRGKRRNLFRDTIYSPHFRYVCTFKEKSIIPGGCTLLDILSPSVKKLARRSESLSKRMEAVKVILDKAGFDCKLLFDRKFSPFHQFTIIFSPISIHATQWIS